MKRPALPSGAQMWNKSQRVWDGVFWLLHNRPSTKGCDRATIWFFWKYYDNWNPNKPTTIPILRRLTSAETVRRRRAEIQNKKQYRIFGSDWIDKLPKGMKETDTGVETRWKYPHLRGSKRTQIKRGVRQEAISNYYGDGYKQTDFMEIGVVSE